MIVVAFVLGILAGGLLAYELIAFLDKIHKKNEGDKNVE